MLRTAQFIKDEKQKGHLIMNTRSHFPYRFFIITFIWSWFWWIPLVLGIVWAFWHIPLWFIPGTSQTYMNFGGFILLTVGYSFIFSWIKEESGNRPFSGLFVHGLANAFILFMPIINMNQNIPQKRFWIWVGLTFLVGIVIMIFRTMKVSDWIRKRII